MTFHIPKHSWGIQHPCSLSARVIQPQDTFVCAETEQMNQAHHGPAMAQLHGRAHPATLRHPPGQPTVHSY